MKIINPAQIINGNFIPLTTASATPADLQRYHAHFIGACRVHAVQHPGQGRAWKTERTAPTDADVQAHLDGKYYIAPVPPSVCREILIDLDVATDADAASLHGRYKDVLAAFPEAAPVIVSTPRGGIHLRYQLAQPIKRDTATAWAKEQLQAAGVALAAGQVEVYPNGTRAIRAPLGAGCYLLDEDLVPVVGTRDAQLAAFFTLLRDEQYDTLDIPADWQPAPASAPAIPSKGRLPIRAMAHFNSSSEFLRDVYRLFAEGLYKAKYTSTAVLRLSWYYQTCRGLDADQAAAEIWAWLQRHHNGNSESFVKTPDKAHAMIRRACEAYDPAKIGGTETPSERRRHPPDPKVALRLKCVTAQLPDRAGRLLKIMLEYAGNRGRTKGRNLVEFDCPSRTLKSFDRCYRAVLDLLIRRGIVAHTSGYSVGHCRVFYFVCGTVPHSVSFFSLFGFGWLVPYFGPALNPLEVRILLFDTS